LTLTTNEYFFFISNFSGWSVKILRRLIKAGFVSSRLSVTSMLSDARFTRCKGRTGRTFVDVHDEAFDPERPFDAVVLLQIFKG
jgi:hypothetical protein